MSKLISKLVTQAIHHADVGRAISEIDQLVSLRQLYGLTEEEIRIAE